jgi:hypothetical protein
MLRPPSIGFRSRYGLGLKRATRNGSYAASVAQVVADRAREYRLHAQPPTRPAIRAGRLFRRWRERHEWVRREHLDWQRRGGCQRGGQHELECADSRRSRCN